MMLWLVFALMTALAVFAVLWPLSRQAAGRAGNDVEVYRDQLDEVARDRQNGLIGEGEAEAARLEISRRLLAADATTIPEKPIGNSLWRRRVVAVAGLAVVPILAATVYLQHGSPQLPGEPLTARLRTTPENQSIQALVSRVEAHIERNPGDGRGWEVLAPVYLRLGRFDDAVKARQKALTLNGETAQRQADLGEALVAAANGIVTSDAKAAFERATVLDPKDPKSRFFIGVAAQQDGERDKAAAIWREMLASAPANAPWAASVRQALSSLGVSAPASPQQDATPGPNAQDIAAAAGMNQTEQSEMIRGMVARLADRLKQDGSDVEGWLRLVRAYMVLGEREKAGVAIADARRALANEPDKKRRIDELAAGLGLKG
jgi:cytochrome c-type biogenesis protein CcmH